MILFVFLLAHDSKLRIAIDSHICYFQKPPFWKHGQKSIPDTTHPEFEKYDSSRSLICICRVVQKAGDHARKKDLGAQITA